MPEIMTTTRNIDRLLDIMARLRDPDRGCPWDLAQTYKTIAPHTIEEAYEVADAIENGDMDFVLGQYRTCWGWSLGDGRTTWLEVFDTRWSHCHQWAGCPTWQLSRALLGLHPRFDVGVMHFDVRLATGSLKKVSGNVPVAGTDHIIKVAWTKDTAGLHYTLETPVPLTLHLDASLTGGKPQSVSVDRRFAGTWSLAGCS
jgi:hypothetical protein